MQHFFYTFFGDGKELTTIQVSVRTLLMFFISIILLRIGGIRIFGRKSAFDDVVAVVLGAILSRGIVGATPFGTVVASGAWICIRKPLFSRWMNGKPILLYNDGELLTDNLRKCSLSEKDILESLRLQESQETLDEIKSVYMETSGRISFVRNQR
jgi:uncharacterized membrane protein YcaP (DUF421 family)